MKKISVIIPTLNEERFLPLTLENLRRQTIKDFELIVKDGLSKDRTVEIAEQYGAKVFSKNDSSLGEARNQGAKSAGGDILVFLDADTLLASDALGKLAEDFLRYDAVMVFPKYSLREQEALIEGKRGSIEKFLVKLWVTFEDSFRKYADVYAGGMCMACDAKAFKRIGGFNENLKVCEDVEISYRFRKIGPVIADHNIVAYPSARRYLKGGLVNSLLTYLTFRLQWQLGLAQPKPKLFR